MKLLLDTHILLWSQLDRKRLSRRAVRALEDARNERWISPVSFWEILTLCRKGRVRLEGGPVAWITTTLARVPFKEAPLTHEVVLATETIALPHRDPFDTFLAATARVYGLTLVTSDTNLIDSKACPVLSNH